MIALLVCLVAAVWADIGDLQRGFERPPDDSRILMRWWWFGPTVTKPQLERELRLMKEGGIGGFELQPVYPVVLDDPGRGLKTLPFLSPEFLEAVRFTAEKARELGLRFDLTLGSGWPYGGPQIPVTQAAGRLRVEKVKVGDSNRVRLPAIGNGEKLIAAFAGGTQRELRAIRDGALWIDGEKPAEVWFFIASRTGMAVKRPSLGAEGFVLDHYDRTALDLYLREVGEPLLKAVGPNKPFAIFCDSLEVFGSDWTGDLLEQFRERRGYDLRPLLPALAGDIGPKTADIRHDWGRTLTELLEERFLKPLHTWVQSQGSRFRIQGYGIPPATIGSNRYTDISEGEGAQWRVVRAARWAASANHLFGRSVTTSETWTWLHSPSFRATPLDMKAEADIHFLQGINQLIGHGWPYTAEGEEYPGWRFYASAVFNEKNPWWIAMPDIAKYLQRVSYLLRQGQPANDVALYLPNADAYSNFTAGRVHMIDALREQVGEVVMPQILDGGYGLDFFDDGSVDEMLASKRYRAVVLPDVERMPPATAQKLKQFEGPILATKRPVDGVDAVLTSETELGRKLNELVPADMTLVPDVGFVHRRTPDADIYFVANTSNTPRAWDAVFRISEKFAEIWNPMNATVMGAGRTSRVRLELDAYESRILVFSNRMSRPAPSLAKTGVAELNQWRLNGNPLNTLSSWTDSDQMRYFSGTAAYETEIEIPKQARSTILDFGEAKPLTPVVTSRNPGIRAWIDAPVREAAVVFVNGKRAGSVWSAPWRLEIGALLKPGRNEIRVVVANTAINHMAGRSLPNYRLLNARYGVRFEPQDMDKIQPIPSGLLGTVKLISYE